MRTALLRLCRSATRSPSATRISIIFSAAHHKLITAPMAPARAPSAQLLRSLKGLNLHNSTINGAKAFSTTCNHGEQAQAEASRESFYKNPKPETVFVPRLEKKLVAAGTPPVGSRRRRMALAQSQGVPFDQLPFQCFQEARKVLIEDRQEKVKQIETIRARIARLQEADPNIHRGGEAYKQKRLDSMRRELEHLKILADINDPNVKRRFEDGKGKDLGCSGCHALTRVDRRHEQAHLPLPSRSQVERVSTEDPSTKDNTDEGCTRCDTSL